MNWLTVLYITHILLWVLVIGLAFSVLQVQRTLDSLAFLLERRASEGPAIGTEAPTLLDASTDPPLLVDTRLDGRATLIWFVAAGCLPCRAHAETIGSVAEEFHEQVRTVVTCVGSVAEAGEFASHITARCRVIADPGRANAGGWRVHSTPFVILVDSDGFVRKKIAEISRAQLQLAVDGLLARADGND